MWLVNLNASCENRTSDICTGVAFDPLEERYYQGFFIALCHNMSLLLNILNDSFSGPCPLSLVRSVDSGTPSEWNKLFKLDEMFEIPRDTNSYCKSKNCTYISMLQHCGDRHNFAHQGVFIFMKTVFTSIQENHTFRPYLRQNCIKRYSKKYEKKENNKVILATTLSEIIHLNLC